MEFGSYIFTDKDDQTIFHNHGEILRQYGSQYKPEHESIYIAYREVERKIQENACDIRRWELKDEILPSETLIKEHKIAELIAKQESLKNEQSSLPICENLAVVFKAVTQLNAALFKGSDSLKLTDVINENLVSLKWLDVETKTNAALQDVPAQTGAKTKGSADRAVRAVANWKMQVQTEATALVLRLRSTGANPTRNSILESMAQWCRNNNVKTDSGIHPSEGYLRTHVLGGKHWDVPN